MKTNISNNVKTLSVDHPAPFYPSSTQMSQKSTAWKKSIAESHFRPSENEKSTLFSTWTPLNDEKANVKLYDERKQLCLKWFETWSDPQRKLAIEDILYSCQPKQLLHTRDILNKISPVYHLDFTRLLPRVVCNYIMSYLDPRSLSRCSQVCWYWKMLTESDQLWMPKCLRFGWNLNYIPSSFESGIWKQFYIENIRALQYMPLANKAANTERDITERSDITLKDISNGRFGFSRFANTGKNRNMPKFKSNGPIKQPPWKSNNSNPNHLFRYNYLDTSEELQAKKASIVKSMKTLTLENIRNQSQMDNSSMHQESIENPNQILENLINKGQTLIKQMTAEPLNKYEKAFQLPNFEEDDISLNKPFSVINHKQDHINNTLTQNDLPKNADLSIKKQAWTLLDS